MPACFIATIGPRQIVFKLLGPEFVRVNYPQMKYEPYIRIAYDARCLRCAIKRVQEELITVLTKPLEKLSSMKAIV